MRTRVKVCCISSVAEVRTAIDAGADALGFVSDMASGPGVTDDRRITAMIRILPPPIASFLLTSRLDSEGIIAHLRRTGASVVQIVDHVDPAVHEAVRAAIPAVRVVQVVHVTGPECLAYAAQAGSTAHALLLDSGKPNATFAELGGTGRTHDWAISRKVVATSAVPVWLAGGLNAENVEEAVRAVRPFGVDLCTGTRTEGHLDPVKLRDFIGAVRKADAAKPRVAT